MAQPLIQPPAQEIRGAIEKEYKAFFEIGTQLKEIIEKTIKTNKESIKTFDKVVNDNAELLKELISNYLAQLQDSSLDYEALGWIELSVHLHYLAQIKAAIELHTMLTGDEIAQVRQKLSEFEGKVYKIAGLMYNIIREIKRNKPAEIKEMLSKSFHGYYADTVEGKFGEVLDQIDKILVITLSDAKDANIKDAIIRMLINYIAKTAAKLRQELVKFKKEEEKVFNTYDIIAFIKKFSNKLLEQIALINVIIEVISRSDMQISKKLDEIVNIIYPKYDFGWIAADAYERLLLALEAILDESIVHLIEHRNYCIFCLSPYQIIIKEEDEKRS